MSYADLAELALLLIVAGIVLVALGARRRYRDQRLPDDLIGAVYGPETPSGSAFRYCPEELRQTYHAVHADGSRRCWTCGTETEAAL